MLLGDLHATYQVRDRACDNVKFRKKLGFGNKGFE